MDVEQLGVLKFIARRLALGLLTLFVVSLVVFAATQLLPSDPAQAILGRNATTTASPRSRTKLGLDHSAFYQYTHWLKGMITGDPGDSFAAEFRSSTTSAIVSSTPCSCWCWPR